MSAQHGSKDNCSLQVTLSSSLSECSSDSTDKELGHQTPSRLSLL